MALIPFRYNLRSLLVRRSSTALTVCSIGATVAVLAGMLSLQQGFATLFQERGREDVAVFLRPGAGSEGESAFRLDLAQILMKETPEVAVDEAGRPLASPELFLAVRRFKVDGGETNVPIRGVGQQTFAIHGDDIRIVEGRNFEPGTDEVIVGRPLVDRFRNCHPGDVLQLNVTPFRVVGVFEAKGAYRSEIWGDVERMKEALERPFYSRVIARLRPDADVEALAARLESDKRVPAKVLTEREYLGTQTQALSGALVGLGLFLGVLMGLAAVFTGTNAMLSALAARTHEIGILMSLGYRPGSVFASFLFEATLLGLFGGVLGCLLVLPLQGFETGTMNFQTFSEVTFAFRTTPEALFRSVVFAMVLGLLGGAWPALRAARLEPTDAMRRG